MTQASIFKTHCILWNTLPGPHKTHPRAAGWRPLPYILAIWGRALSCKRMIPSDSTARRFDFMARRSTLIHQETNHTSLLFIICLDFQCWPNTLYTTLTSRSIKKQLYGPVRFHYACLLPYIWQYRYVTTVMPALARNVFYGGCSDFIWLPLMFPWGRLRKWNWI